MEHRLVYLALTIGEFRDTIQRRRAIHSVQDEKCCAEIVYKQLLGEHQVVLHALIPRSYIFMPEYSVMLGFEQEQISGTALRANYAILQSAVLTAIDQEAELGPKQVSFCKTRLSHVTTLGDLSFCLPSLDLRLSQIAYVDTPGMVQEIARALPKISCRLLTKSEAMEHDDAPGPEDTLAYRSRGSIPPSISRFVTKIWK
ncbi:MAG: hypothetical protein WCJ29_02895 [bacterium]